MKPAIKTTIAPWVSVHNSLAALDFYKSAFGALELYRLDVPDGVIARLSVDGAEFWLGAGSQENSNESSIRIILTVADPDPIFARALKAGATVIYPIAEEHGWRLGRVADPFGIHWEIGYQL